MATIDQVAQPVPVSRSMLAREAWRRLRPGDRAALVFFAGVLVVGLLGPLIAPHDPGTPVAAPFTPPGEQPPLGTDGVGRDLLTRILHGAQLSWIGALGVTLAGAVVGIAVGLVAGAVGGWIDSLLMRTTDAFLALPAPMLALAIAAALGPSLTNAMLAVIVVWWPLYARVIRGQVTALAARPHIEAAKLSGVSTVRIWLRHLLPGALPPVIVIVSLDLGAVVLVLAGLSFLGLGSGDPATELGTMTAVGLPNLLSAPWVALFPALAVFMIAFASNLAGDAVSKLLSEES